MLSSGGARNRTYVTTPADAGSSFGDFGVRSFQLSPLPRSRQLTVLQVGARGGAFYDVCDESLILPQMHRCLRIPEILNFVCECILADRLRRKPTLIALTECCKTFYGPAVSALWRELDSLLPLLRSLPYDLWSTAGDVHKYVSATIG